MTSLENRAANVRLLALDVDALVQVLLGVMYKCGTGVEQDFTEAARFYRLAAAQGNVLAMNELACLYRNAEGVPQDFAEARRLYEIAAEEGNQITVDFA